MFQTIKCIVCVRWNHKADAVAIKYTAEQFFFLKRIPPFPSTHHRRYYGHTKRLAFTLALSCMFDEKPMMLQNVRHNRSLTI